MSKCGYNFKNSQNEGAKGRFNDFLTVPILSYDSGVWAVIKNYCKRILAEEVRFFHSVGGYAGKSIRMELNSVNFKQMNNNREEHH